jgi:hypothetical protein
VLLISFSLVGCRSVSRRHSEQSTHKIFAASYNLPCVLRVAMLGTIDAIELWARCKMYMIVRREGSDVLILGTRSNSSRNMLPGIISLPDSPERGHGVEQTSTQQQLDVHLSFSTC